MIKVEFHAMGCGMAAFIDRESEAAIHALEQVPAWFEQWEQVLSRFRPDSELNQLNAAAGEDFSVSPTLWEVVQAALEAARFSDGLVTPTILKSLHRAGYDRSFDQLQTAQDPGKSVALSLYPSAERVGSALWRDIRIDAERRTVNVPVGAGLDLGGIAKGWAAQQAMLILKDFGPALVDASGDIAVSGAMEDGTPWPVDIDDPLEFQPRLDQLALTSGGVATSGIDYRRWLQNGSWKHHIIDPRSGEPAQTDLLSVTVVAPDVLQAEAAAKVALILGSQAGLEWLEEQDSICGLLALQDGHLVYSSGLQDHLRG